MGKRRHSIPQWLAVPSFRAGEETRRGGGRVSGQVTPSFISLLFFGTINQTSLLLLMKFFYPTETCTNEQTSFFPSIPAFQKFPSDEGQMAEHAGQLERRSSGWDVSKLLLFQPPSRVESEAAARPLFLLQLQVKKKGESVSKSKLFRFSLENLKFPTKTKTEPPLQSGPDHRSAAVEWEL